MRLEWPGVGTMCKLFEESFLSLLCIGLWKTGHMGSNMFEAPSNRAVDSWAHSVTWIEMEL